MDRVRREEGSSLALTAHFCHAHTITRPSAALEVEETAIYWSSLMKAIVQGANEINPDGLEVGGIRLFLVYEHKMSTLLCTHHTREEPQN